MQRPGPPNQVDGHTAAHIWVPPLTETASQRQTSSRLESLKYFLSSSSQKCLPTSGQEKTTECLTNACSRPSNLKHVGR